MLYRRGLGALVLGLSVALIACAEGSGLSPDASGTGDVIDASAIDARPRADAMPGVETCNGVDDDDDQFVDEGTAEELCGEIDHGTPKCNGLGGCSVDGCEVGFVDVDGRFDTGCECIQEAGESNTAVCEDGVDIGELADTNTEMLITGTLAPAGDVDFFRFRATDTPDTTCDAYHVRITLMNNPGDQYHFQVFRGGCAGTMICDGVADSQWYTNFAGGGTGQCPCTTGNSSTVNRCEDDGAEFVVRVARKDGTAVSCEPYTLEISNGKYQAP